MPDDEQERSSRRGSTPAIRVTLALVVIVLGWIVILPPSSGADEPGHLVRSAALVRGDLEGEGNLNVVFVESFELPAWVGWPPPGCWAFRLDVPVSCATLLEEPTGTEVLGTRSANYPIWGHILPGIPTLLVDDPIGNRLGRIAHAIVPTLLVAASLTLAARRGRFAAAGTLLAVTPMVLFTAATVNPSGLVIAGGIGLWTSILAVRPGEVAPRLASWLAAASWAAMVLPRRDGLIYASLILAIVLVTGVRDIADLRRLVGRPQAVVIGGSTLATFAWAVTSTTSGSRLLIIVPVVPVAAWAARRWWLRSPWPIAGRAAAAAVAALVVAVGAIVWVQRRDPLLDTEKWRAIVGETGGDLVEWFGVLGWLDAPIPDSFAFLFVAVIGVLAGVVAMIRPALVVPAVVVVVVATLASWWLTATQVGGSPEYWQGRYYAPLLVGVPILLGGLVDVLGDVRVRVIARTVGLLAAIISLVALGAAMRRFAVGIDGTMAPWRWHTFGAAVSPLWPLLLIAVAWVALLVSLDQLAGSADDAATATAEPTDDRESVLP